MRKRRFAEAQIIGMTKEQKLGKPKERREAAIFAGEQNSQARQGLKKFECSAPGALAQPETDDYQNQTRRLSYWTCPEKVESTN